MRDHGEIKTGLTTELSHIRTLETTAEIPEILSNPTIVSDASVKIQTVRERIDTIPDHTIITRSPEAENIQSIETEKIKLSVDTVLVRKFLLEYCGLTGEEVDQVKIEIVTNESNTLFKRRNLRWSTDTTRKIARYLPHYRLREIFTRTQTLDHASIKIFINNVEAQVNETNIEEFVKDLGHHLMHVAQRIKHRRGNKVLGALKRSLWHWPKHQISRLPGFHSLSPAERDARDPVGTNEFIGEYRGMVTLERK